MKVVTVILFVVLVAGTAAAVHPTREIHPISVNIEKGIIEDAQALLECLMKGLAVLQDSIDNVILTVNGISGIIDGMKAELDACLAIGGENPSLIDQIQQAQCISKLVETSMQTIISTVADVQNSVAQVIIAGNNILQCFSSNA